MKHQNNPVSILLVVRQFNRKGPYSLSATCVNRFRGRMNQEINRGYPTKADRELNLQEQGSGNVYLL
jgi:hypothetical protein